MEQRSEEWFAARLGKVTASRLADVLATIKTGESASRRNYRIELVCERLTMKKADGFSNIHTERGVELEPIAKSAYEAQKGYFVDDVGFVNHPTILMSGASPDGLVADDGLIEIKCPTPANHLESVLSKKAPSKYIPQMQWQMACTGRKWCDFVSYCAEFGATEHALFVTRVHRDDVFIQDAEKAVIEFLNEVELQVQQLKGN